MTPELWERIERVYHAALEREPDQRATYIASACDGDERLRREVESLLERDASSPDNLLNHCVRLGPYEITGPLGAGGMGEVYKARDSRLGRDVAIKVLPQEMVADADRRARFAREAKSASRLNHPNIVTIYDVGEFEGRAYIAMEYVPGETLEAGIPAGGLSLMQALNYAIPIADALAKAHAAGLIHRDLKPSNIMVTPVGTVKLLDFGLAKLIEDAPGSAGSSSSPETQSMAVVGTPGYMSPEQAEGKTVDSRSDVFSFGSVLYQMVTGKRAFHGDSMLATMASVLNKDPDALPDGTPRDLERVILRCLRKDPERRWQSMADVRVALEELREDHPSGRMEAPPTRGPGRARWLMLGAAGVLAAVALAGGAAWERWRTPEPEVWSGTLLGGPTIVSHPRISPDGHWLLFRAIINEQSQLAVMKPDAGSWTLLTHDENLGSMQFAAWARDGSKIYFDRQQTSRNIYSIGPLGGEARLLLENAGGPEPLPDGSMVVERPALNGRRQLLHFWPDSGRLEALPAEILTSDTRTVAAFPDGREIAVFGFSSTGGRRHLFALDLASRNVRELSAPSDLPVPNATTESQHPEAIAVSADGQTVFSLRNRDDSMLVVAVPRDGSKRDRVLFSFPIGATPLAFDAAPDGSIYMDESAFQVSVLRMGAADNTLTETAIPKDATGMLPLPDGFVFALERGGKSQLLMTRAGSEPRPLLNTNESTRLPGAWLGNGRVAFIIGDANDARLAIGSVEDGQVLQRFQSDARDVSAVAASPGAHTLYYSREGIVWAQLVEGGEPRKIGAGYDVMADPAGKTLYVMRAGPRGYELWQMRSAGGEAQKIDLPAEYTLTPNRFSPAGVNRDGRVLLPVNSVNRFFFRAAILDPLRRSVSLVPAPPQTVVLSAAWAPEGGIVARVTRWSSTLWRYTKSNK